jgi:phage protein D
MSGSSGVRSPRVQIVIEGEPTPLVECSVNVSRHARSDTFTGATPLGATGRDLAYWASVGPVPCIVQACNDKDDDWTDMLTGQLDRVSVRADAYGGVRVEFSGRDKTAKLLDARTTKKSPNKKASEIVRDYAKKHGLKADVDDTDDYAGKQHLDENAHLVANDSDWNTIAALAEREGAFLFLKGDTLYFKQPGKDDVGFGAYPILFVPPGDGDVAQGNITDITLTQNVHLNKGVKQTVRSFHTRKQKNITTTKNPEGSGGGEPLEWIDEIPGLTDAQVEKVAKKRQTEKQRHEMRVEVSLPGDVTIDPRQMLDLHGTDSAWDQRYHIDTINHSWSPVDGYTMRVSGKNKKGGEGGSSGGGSGGNGGGNGGGAGGDTPGATPETFGPFQPQATPLPPSRPTGL